MQKILLVEAPYLTRYYPLGLMRISNFHKAKGNIVKFIKGNDLEAAKNFDPDEIWITSLFTYEFDETIKTVRFYKHHFSNKRIIIGGILASCRPELFQKEGIEVHVGLLPEAEEYPPDYELFPDIDYSLSFTSRGCVNSCLTGDTILNTIEGNIPIKDLINKEKIGLFTFDPKTEKVFITDGIECRKTGDKVKVIRVNFDDGTHIDCTPDHRFLVFKNGNQFNKVVRWEVEAQYLKPKMRVHAVRFNETKKGYGIVSWGRNKTMLLSRMIAEYKLGRKLKDNEVPHHIDKNPNNNHIDNIQIVDKKEHHKIHHNDLSQRMKENNPCKFLTKESWEKIRKAITGLKRTPEQKMKYRLTKLGEKNPNYGKHPSKETRIKMSKSQLKRHKKEIFYINHKILSIEEIDNEDVYNLEVPSTHWFFANNVLVHNCGFCIVPKLEGKVFKRDWVQDINPKFKKIIFWDNNWFAKPKDEWLQDVTELKRLVKENDINLIDFNQGLDCRIVTEWHFQQMEGLPIKPIRFAFDHMGEDGPFQKAAELSKKYGFTNISVYILYNWMDTPEDLYYRMKTVSKYVSGGGGCGFLMKYQPLDALKRGVYIGKHWTKKEVKAIQKINPYPYGQVSSKTDEEFEYFFGKDAMEFKKLLNFKDIKKLALLKANKFNKRKIFK